MRGGLAKRARVPMIPFSGMSRQDHTPSNHPPAIWLCPLPWPSPRTRRGCFRLGSWGVSLGGECLDDRGGKKGMYLLCIPISWLVRGVASHSWKPFHLAIFCFLLVRAIFRLGSWVVRLSFPSLTQQGLSLFCVLSWYSFFLWIA